MSFAALNEYVALEIFHAFVVVDHNGPYTLIQVSNMWKDMSFRSPTLWTYVDLNDLNPDWEQRLAVSLTLSQGRPLHVFLRVPFLRMRSLKSFVSKWKTLEISLSSDEGIGDIAEAILRLLERDDQKDGIVETLEEIKWVSPDGVPFDPPQDLLQQFRTHIFDRWHSRSTHPNSDEYQTLSEERLVKTLRIDYGRRLMEFGNDSSTIFQFLSHYQHISHLHLTLYEVVWDTKSGFEVLYLPNLEECSIIREPHSRISLQSVEKPTSDRFLEALKAQNLRKLSLIDGCLPLRKCLAFILPAEFPSLGFLSLTAMWEQSDSIYFSDFRRDAVSPGHRHSLPFRFLGRSDCLLVPTIHELHLDISILYWRKLWDTFFEDIVAVAANAKRLRLNDSSSTLSSGQNHYVLSRFPKLEELEWKGNIVPQEWIDDSKFITLPKLWRVKINLDIEDIEKGKRPHLPLQLPTVRILPFNAPALEEFTLNSWNLLGEPRYLQMGISTFIADSNHPNSSNLISLHFTDPYLVFDFFSSSQEVVLENITALQCNLETAASLTPFIPNLTTLTLVYKRMLKRRFPGKGYGKCVNFLKDLARSTTLVSIDFGGWGWQEKDFDIYLSEKRRILSEQRERPDNSTSLAQSLRHISVRGYPNWNVLVDALRLLHDNDPTSLIKSMKLPGLPHPSILVPIRDALKGRFTDEFSTTNLEEVLVEEGARCCQYCLASGWKCCVNQRNSDDWTAPIPCERHSLTDMVEINSYTL